MERAVGTAAHRVGRGRYRLAGIRSTAVCIFAGSGGGSGCTHRHHASVPSSSVSFASGLEIKAESNHAVAGWFPYQRAGSPHGEGGSFPNGTSL